MKNFFIISFVLLCLFSCSHKKQVTYLNDLSGNNLKKINENYKNNIVIGDILKIDVNTTIAEASLPYKSTTQNSTSIELLLAEGFTVENDSTIMFPVLGEINVVGLSTRQLGNKVRNMLIIGGHLTNPYVIVKKINSKYTVLGEVNNPGTFSSFDNRLNIFQALGNAGDLQITGKRNNIVLIREENGLRKTYKFSLNNSEIFDKPYYFIKSNDVIIVEPNFSKIKSAGFIGSPSSIASISSLLLSITLLLINK